MLSLLETVLLPLIEQVRLRRSQVDDLRAAVPVLFHLRAFATIVRVRDAGAPTNNAPPLIGPIIALVADSNEGTGSHIRIADHTFAVALFAQPADGDAGLLAAHYQIGVMLGHGVALRLNPRATRRRPARRRRFSLV